LKIVVFDIETTGLNGIMGRVLCGSFYPIWTGPGRKSKPYTIRIDKKPWNNPDDIIDDTKVLEAIRDELEKYNMIVTWNGKQFDVPFVNARLMRAGKRRFEPHFHLDLMYYAGGISMRVGSRKLVNVQKFMGVDALKNPPGWEVWDRAKSGDKKAMDTLAKYCENDVKGTAELYHKMIGAVKNIHR
jgi:uncharacterized protein YprB with RNaseH-like and TPR domain